MKDGKLIYSFHVHVIYLRFHNTRQCCKNLGQVVKFCDGVNLMFQTSATWNWHTESMTNIIQSIAFLR